MTDYTFPSVISMSNFGSSIFSLFKQESLRNKTRAVIAKPIQMKVVIRYQIRNRNTPDSVNIQLKQPIVLVNMV